jgi:hypothetical protein
MVRYLFDISTNSAAVVRNHHGGSYFWLETNIDNQRKDATAGRMILTPGGSSCGKTEIHPGLGIIHI